MDDLSEVLRVVALGGGVFLDAEFTEPFAFVGKAARSLCTGVAVTGDLICFTTSSRAAFTSASTAARRPGSAPARR